jgi:3-oxoacyl-[acyl-carrier protein] reductase
MPTAAFDGTVSLITGGASGIGAALCRRLAAPGRAIVVHTGANTQNAERIASEVEQAGAEAMIATVDFSDPRRAGALVAQTRERFGRLDHLVHLAGYADRRKVGDLDAEGLECALSTSARSFFHLATAAIDLLRAAPAGRVITAGSFVAQVYRLSAEFFFPATAAAKAALIALTKSLAAQLAPDGVAVNCVVPGFIEKAAGQHTSLDDAARRKAIEFIPLQRFGKPDEVAAVIEFLLSVEGGYITGQLIHVDGGITL